MPELELDGRELYYEVAGDGRAVVLLHSAIADHSLWDSQVETLRDRFRVVRYDIAGYGRSALPSGPISPVRDLERLFEHLGVERASLVGNSFGARIALEYTLAHPDVVDALVLVAPGLPDHDWTADARRADEEETRLFEAGDFGGAAEAQLRLWVDGPGRGPDAVDPALRERARRMILRSYELYADAAEGGEPKAEWPDPPASARLDEIRVAALIAVGEHDVPDMFAIADRFEAGIAGARTVVVPGAAHLLPMERPVELNRILGEFLTAV
jgi:pimeloyl-ACP methyl ester carboxylesterase